MRGHTWRKIVITFTKIACFFTANVFSVIARAPHSQLVLHGELVAASLVHTPSFLLFRHSFPPFLSASCQLPFKKFNHCLAILLFVCFYDYQWDQTGQKRLLGKSLWSWAKVFPWNCYSTIYSICSKSPYSVGCFYLRSIFSGNFISVLSSLVTLIYLRPNLSGSITLACI